MAGIRSRSAALKLFPYRADMKARARKVERIHVERNTVITLLLAVGAAFALYLEQPGITPRSGLPGPGNPPLSENASGKVNAVRVPSDCTESLVVLFPVGKRFGSDSAAMNWPRRCAAIARMWATPPTTSFRWYRMANPGTSRRRRFPFRDRRIYTKSSGSRTRTTTLPASTGDAAS